MPASLKAERTRWLKRKGLTLKAFSKATGQEFGTAYKWNHEGRTPRKLYLAAVLNVFPDWPHAS